MIEKSERERQQCPYKALERVAGKGLGSGISQSYFKPELHCLCDLGQVT